MCLHPFCGFDTGTVTSNGKPAYVIVQEHYEKYKVFPFEYAEKKGFHVDRLKAKWRFDKIGPVLTDPVPIPCGHCWQCILEQSKTWAVRGVLESQYHKYNYFLTLTYDDDCLKFLDGVAVLDMEDHKRFMKRLRKMVGCKSIRYLMCGEYGETTGRPHYHYILFMDKPLPLQLFKPKHFHSPVIDNCWKFGLHDISFCEPGCVAYVAGYVVKKAKLISSSYVVPPFRSMSRKPGLGRQYFDEHPEMIDTLKVYGDFGSVRSRGLPRYFKGLLDEEYKALKPKLIELADLAHDNDVAVHSKTSFEDIGFAKGEYIKRDVFSKEDKS